MTHAKAHETILAKLLIGRGLFVRKLSQYFFRRIVTIFKGWMIETFVGYYCQYRRAVQPDTSEYKIYLDDPEQTRIGAIEINANCNLNCVMCNTQLSKRKHSDPMNPAVFEQAVKYLVETGQTLGAALHTIGEPLINPLLEEYFKILKKHGIKAYLLSTNAQFLEAKFELLVQYREQINILHFSIDGASKETYEKIRRPGRFDTLLRNLDFFRENNAGGKYFPDVRINSIVSSDVLHELGYHVKFYSQYVDIEKINLSLLNGISPDNSYFMEHSLLAKHIVPNRPCKVLNRYGVDVLCDGRVSSCGRDYNGDVVIGNIMDSAPRDLINSEVLVNLRKSHAGYSVVQKSLCHDCFKLDERVEQLFAIFYRKLISDNKKNWDVDKTQKKFEEFFRICADTLPTYSQFEHLIRS